MRTLTPASLGIKPGQPIELDGRHDLILNLAGWRLDCQHRILIGVLVQDCRNVTVRGGTVLDAANQGDEVGHSFQTNRGSNITFDGCHSYSSYEAGKPLIEDHFSGVGTKNARFVRCYANGPTTPAGTGFCLDEGSEDWLLAQCTGLNLGPTGVTVASGPGRIHALYIAGTTDACVRFRSIEYGYGLIKGPVLVDAWDLHPKAGKRVDIEAGQEGAIKLPAGGNP